MTTFVRNLRLLDFKGNPIKQKLSVLNPAAIVRETASYGPGFATVEWILILGVVVVPTATLIFTIMVALERFYSVTSWVIALPFP